MGERRRRVVGEGGMWRRTQYLEESGGKKGGNNVEGCEVCGCEVVVCVCGGGG